MIDKIGIIGAGQMGNGVAHVSALAGLDVTLIDVVPAQLDKALKTIEDFVSLMQGLSAGDSVLFKIERDGWKSDVRLTLSARS